MQFIIHYQCLQHYVRRVVTVDTDVDELYKDVRKSFDAYGVDDFHIEAIDCSKRLYQGINWVEALSSGQTIRREVLEMLASDPNSVFKLALLSYDVGLFDIIGDEVCVVLPEEYTDYTIGNNEKYPDEWLNEQAAIFYPELLQALENVFADSYFGELGWARLFADKEANGELTTKWFGETFVYYHGNL